MPTKPFRCQRCERAASKSIGAALFVKTGWKVTLTGETSLRYRQRRGRGEQARVQYEYECPCDFKGWSLHPTILELAAERHSVRRKRMRLVK